MGSFIWEWQVGEWFMKTLIRGGNAWLSCPRLAMCDPNRVNATNRGAIAGPLTLKKWRLKYIACIWGLWRKLLICITCFQYRIRSDWHFAVHFSTRSAILSVEWQVEQINVYHLLNYVKSRKFTCHCGRRVLTGNAASSTLTSSTLPIRILFRQCSNWITLSDMRRFSVRITMLKTPAVWLNVDDYAFN